MLALINAALLPLIQTYAAAETANTNKNKMKRKVSRLLAVTRFTPNKIVLSSFPCQLDKIYIVFCKFFCKILCR